MLTDFLSQLVDQGYKSANCCSRLLFHIWDLVVTVNISLVIFTEIYDDLIIKRG